MSAPAFLNKPKHKDNVIATPRGWVVEKTGELLVSVKNLDQRIAEHLGLPTFNFAAPVVSGEAQVVSLVAPVVDFTDTTLPVVADTAIADLLDTLADAPVTAVVEAVVPPVVVPEVVKEISAEPVIVKKKLGRPPKIRPVEGEVVAAPAPVAKVEDKPAEEPVVETKAVLEA